MLLSESSTSEQLRKYGDQQRAGPAGQPVVSGSCDLCLVSASQSSPMKSQIRCLILLCFSLLPVQKDRNSFLSFICSSSSLFCVNVEQTSKCSTFAQLFVLWVKQSCLEQARGLAAQHCGEEKDTDSYFINYTNNILVKTF